MLKTRIQPNTISTLNVWEMVTLTRLHQEPRILWAQIIFNHLMMMTRTKVVVPTKLNNIWKILEYTGVPMCMFSVNFKPENFNWMFLAMFRL